MTRYEGEILFGLQGDPQEELEDFVKHGEFYGTVHSKPQHTHMRSDIMPGDKLLRGQRRTGTLFDSVIPYRDGFHEQPTGQSKGYQWTISYDVVEDARVETGKGDLEFLADHYTFPPGVETIFVPENGQWHRHFVGDIREDFQAYNQELDMLPDKMTGSELTLDRTTMKNCLPLSRSSRKTSNGSEEEFAHHFYSKCWGQLTWKDPEGPSQVLTQVTLFLSLVITDGKEFEFTSMTEEDPLES